MIFEIEISEQADRDLRNIYKILLLNFSPQKMRQVNLTDWRRASWDLTRCRSVFLDTKRSRGTAEACASFL